MASFNDLPQDVLWLIFRETISIRLINNGSRCKYFEEENFFLANPFGLNCANQVESLALINKKSLKLIRSKCFKTKNRKRWWFIKGALTQKYK